MNVGAMLKGLSYGELRHLFVGMDGAGTISDIDRDRMVFFANQALKHIYSRLSHNISYVILRLVEGRTTYAIRPVHAVTNATVGNTNPRFIIDTAADKFTGQVIKIRKVRRIVDPLNAEAEELNLLINDEGGLTPSVKTLNFDTLYFRKPVANTEYQVELQLAHPELTLPALDSEEIIIAPALEEALLVRIAAAVFRSMNGEENAGKAQRLDARFEECMQVVGFEDLMQDSSSNEDGRITFNGWI